MLRLIVVFSLLVGGCHCADPNGNGNNPGCLKVLTPCSGILCGGGGNSPFVNTFPVNGLSPVGKCNADQIRLVTGSLQAKNCPTKDKLNLELATDGSLTHLVGRKNGKTECSGDQLKEATFTVGTLTHEVQLRIADVRTFKVDDTRSNEGYRIERAEGSGDGSNGGQSACDYNTAVGILKDLGFSDPDAPKTAAPMPDGYTPDPDDAFALAVAGPVFNAKTGKVIFHGDNYFNLACMGDALAKTKLNHLDTTEQGTVAALRMITARYANSNAYTVRGAQIAWVKFHETKHEPQLEALWDSDGKVLCLDMPRLATLIVNGQPYDTKQLPTDLQPKGCAAAGSAAGSAGSGSASTPGVCDRDEWIAKLKDESGANYPCSSVPMDKVALASCTDIDGKLVLSSKNICSTAVTATSAPATAPTNPGPAAPK